MPKKATKPNEKNSASGNTFTIGKINAGGDVVMGDQHKTINQTSQTLNITSPVQFIEELQKLKAEIDRLKSLPDVDPAVARRLVAVEGDIVDAIVEAQKEKPVAERIKTTLDGAKETMEKLNGSIATAMKLGATLGTLGSIALTVWKTLGG